MVSGTPKGNEKAQIVAHGRVREWRWAPGYTPRMPLYTRHVFVCENRRPEDDPRGCCAASGSQELRIKLRDAVKAAGLKGAVRVNSAGCLDQCAHGAAVVVYPEAVWYGGVTPADVAEIVESHLVGGRPVERLRLAHMRPASET